MTLRFMRPAFNAAHPDYILNKITLIVHRNVSHHVQIFGQDHLQFLLPVVEDRTSEEVGMEIFFRFTHFLVNQLD